MFGKSIKFIEDIDGTLIPIVENRAWNVEYMLEDAECHGRGLRSGPDFT